MTNIYHSHDFYEVICFLRGEGLQTLNETQLKSKENDVVILRPCDRHSFFSQTNDIEMVSLSIKKEEFELFSVAYDPHLLNVINNSPCPITFSSSLFELRNFCENTKRSITEYDCKFLLSYFLNMYISETDCLTHNSEIPQMIVSAIEEMKKSDNLKRGIDAFTELSHYSHSHLARLIKTHFGVSLKQYINEMRLQNAYNDIILTNKSTEEISENLGFASISHFNKIFKDRFLITPAELRKRKGAWTT